MKEDRSESFQHGPFSHNRIHQVTKALRPQTNAPILQERIRPKFLMVKQTVQRTRTRCDHA